MNVQFDAHIVFAEKLLVTFYYVREGEDFKVLEERPYQGEYGELEIEIAQKGEMGGPSVTFREVGRGLRGELLDLPRKGSPASMDIALPEGILLARDGVGDWTKIINLSQRPSDYVKS